MLGGGMVKRKREKKREAFLRYAEKAPCWATLEGWRRSALTEEGGMLSGHLANMPVNADPASRRGTDSPGHHVKGLAHAQENFLKFVAPWPPETGPQTVLGGPRRPCHVSAHSSRPTTPDHPSESGRLRGWPAVAACTARYERHGRPPPGLRQDRRRPDLLPRGGDLTGEGGRPA